MKKTNKFVAAKEKLDASDREQTAKVPVDNCNDLHLIAEETINKAIILEQMYYSAPRPARLDERKIKRSARIDTLFRRFWKISLNGKEYVSSPGIERLWHESLENVQFSSRNRLSQLRPLNARIHDLEQDRQKAIARLDELNVNKPWDSETLDLKELEKLPKYRARKRTAEFEARRNQALKQKSDLEDEIVRLEKEIEELEEIKAQDRIKEDIDLIIARYGNRATLYLNSAHMPKAYRGLAQKPLTLGHILERQLFLEDLWEDLNTAMKEC